MAETEGYDLIPILEERRQRIATTIEVLREILCETEAIMNREIKDVFSQYWIEKSDKYRAYSGNPSRTSPLGYKKRREALYSLNAEMEMVLADTIDKLKSEKVKQRIFDANSRRSEKTAP